MRPKPKEPLRFWAEPKPMQPGMWDFYAVYDEDTIGVIAYFVEKETAEKYAAMLQATHEALKIKD